ncbi:MAG: hypothetical protein COX70_08435 [Flavobacteriales bacterium CG_4_10_14_0_2_um_filter_32_8]|nr:MAG: hypothetical protein COX70_08435 [Flavobacteriales bacterium CG_4_10_14_0_2_um_filter_32_8]
MNKPILLFAFLFLNSALFCQTTSVEKINYRKLTYSDFTKIAVNDTSIAVIDLFFSKKENAMYNQMSLLPLSIVLFAIPPSRLIGVGTAVISVPLFLNGSYTLVKYRKKKLYKVLVDYKKTQTLPQWVRKRANKLLVRYDDLEMDY